MAREEATLASLSQASSQVAASRPSRLRIEASRGWRSLRLRELWEYRELLWFLTTRDIRGRYRQMALGPLWIALKPLLNMVIFSLVFGELARLPSDGVPYPIFSYAALLPWTYFANAATSATGSLVSRLNVISKVYFPRLVLPLSAVLSGLVDLGVSFLILVGMMLFYGFIPSTAVLVLPLYILLAAATALCVGLWSATLAVRYRDLQYGISYLIQAGMYLTPVVYSSRLIAEQWQPVYRLNPMYWTVEGFRWALLGSGHAPEPYMLVSVGLVLLLLATGAFVFRRTERTIVDWL